MNIESLKKEIKEKRKIAQEAERLSKNDYDRHWWAGEAHALKEILELLND